MAQYIKPANIFGRIGTGVGRGMAEQIPKEIEHARKNAGLQEYLKDTEKRNPQENLAALHSIYGLQPEDRKQFQELQRYQAKADAFNNQNFGNPGTSANIPPRGNSPPSNFAPPQGAPGTASVPPNVAPPGMPPSTNQTPPSPGAPSPSITSPELAAVIQRGYKYPQPEELEQKAQQEWRTKGPGFFNNNIDEARKYVGSQEKQRLKSFLSDVEQQERLSKVQEEVKAQLQAKRKRLGAEDLGGDLYNEIEKKALLAAKPKEFGGRGLTEQQAADEYGKVLDEAAKNFNKLKSVGGWAVVGRPAEQTLNTFRGLRNFAEEKDKQDGSFAWTENAAQSAIADTQISPGMAYANFQPVSNVPELNQTLKNLNLRKIATDEGTYVESFAKGPTLEVAPALANLVQKYPNASPLAIAYELEKKGFDGSEFLKYLTSHPELNLKEHQKRQAGTPLSAPGVFPLNDWWLSSFTGIK